MDAQAVWRSITWPTAPPQQLYEMLSESFAPIRDDALTATPCRRWQAWSAMSLLMTCRRYCKQRWTQPVEGWGR
ncbi:hypothetical protein WJX84_009783 [Apatococcus fuscideae]|uniref:Uncharacterized protein n=1 Tax=Apatococcus fuscideae TaxID=2026836 RepID=A0AAW1SKW4_9CHLO